MKQVQADYAQARQEIEALKQKLVAARTDADSQGRFRLPSPG